MVVVVVGVVVVVVVVVVLGVVVSSSRLVYISGHGSSVIILQKLDVRTSSRLRACWALKKSGGSKGGAAPPAMVWGGPPHLQTYSLSRQEKAWQRDCGVFIVAITTIIQ